jgi:hypothetical protein
MTNNITRAGLIGMFGGLVAASLIGLAGPAAAHHSTAMFEWGKEAPPLQGTIVAFEWTQPHVWIKFDVPNPKAEGGVDHYGIEGMSPSYLSRMGWSKRTLNPGDKVTMILYPLKDGQKGGFCAKVILPNGKVLANAPQRAPT